jgi:hypothetical protein
MGLRWNVGRDIDDAILTQALPTHQYLASDTESDECDCDDGGHRM